MKIHGQICRLLCSFSLIAAPHALAQDETDLGAEPTTEDAAPNADETPADEAPPAEAPAETPPDMGPSDAGPSSAPDHGLLGPLRIGPTFAFGLPHPMNYGIDALYDRTWGLAFATGKLTLPMGKVEAQLANWDFRVRWHPGRGSFFWGLAYGQQKILVEAEEDLKFKAQDIDVTVPALLQLELESMYVTPHFGWFAMWDSGFTLGFELGAQVPMSSKASLDVQLSNVTPSQEAEVKKQDKYTKLEESVEDAGKLLGKTTLPYLTLLRLGWMF